MLQGNRLAAVICAALLSIVVMVVVGAWQGFEPTVIGQGITGAVSLGSVAAVVVRDKPDSE